MKTHISETKTTFSETKLHSETKRTLQVRIVKLFQNWNGKLVGGRAFGFRNFQLKLCTTKSVWRRRKFGGRFLVRNVQARGMTELIPTVKMETRHPVEGYFGNEFRSICSHCGVMAAWSHKTLNFCEFCGFKKKRSLTEKIFKILFWKNSSPYRSTCCMQIFREIWPTENR